MIKCIKTSFFTLPFCINFAIMFYVYKSIQKGEEIMDKNKEFKPYIPANLEISNGACRLYMIE